MEHGWDRSVCRCSGGYLKDRANQNLVGAFGSASPGEGARKTKMINTAIHFQRLDHFEEDLTTPFFQCLQRF
jgi:hypothetical protein